MIFSSEKKNQKPVQQKKMEEHDRKEKRSEGHRREVSRENQEKKKDWKAARSDGVEKEKKKTKP
jgi:hypothetical protein